MVRAMIDQRAIHPKTLILGVFTPDNRMGSPEYYFEEFLSLVKTADIHYDDVLFTKVRQVDNNMYFTKGKLEELVQKCTEMRVEHLVISETLSPLQERNLENVLNCRIIDREQLILTIFKRSAHTSEGKIQVEMAEIEFMKTRIIGRGKELAQQSGIIGPMRGPGETEKEEIKRVFAEKLRQAKKRLDTLARSREVQRKQRLSSNVPLICIIGYTNAGKSSLLNRIAKGQVLAEDKLFATLDTTTRELFIDGHKKALISDTVGFISQLPHHLINAFKSTLDELKYADLLLHVIDAACPAWENQIEVVHQTLKELDVDKPMLYVFNKIDKLTEDQRTAQISRLILYTPHVLIHTMSKEGIEPLVTYMRSYKF
jgi:GTP-binding protein HflX